MKAGVYIEPGVLEAAERPDPREHDQERSRAFLREYGL